MEEKPPHSINGIKPYLDKLTLGVTRVLEASPGVTEVMFVEKEPAERHAITSWEQVENDWQNLNYLHKSMRT